MSGVYERQGDQVPLTRRHERIGAGAAHVARVTQCYCGQTVLAGLNDSQIYRESCPDLAQCAAGVHNSGTRVVANYGGCRSGLKASLADGPRVLVVTNRAMGVVSEEI